MNISRWIDRTFYPSYGDNWDNDLFKERILAALKKEFRVLDLGAGAGIIPQMNFRGQVEHVVGLDLDERVIKNPYLDCAYVGSAEKLPFPDESFDLVFSTNVFEHLPDPAAVLREVRRVLRPRGLLFVKTPNRRHYAPSIARLTPHWFHQFVNKLRGRPRDDTFPTLYRANSPRTLSRLAAKSGLAVIEIQTFEGRPEYLRLFWPLYLIGMLYERLVNRIQALGAFRVLLIAVFTR